MTPEPPKYPERPPLESPQPCEPTMDLLKPETHGWLDGDELDERVTWAIIGFVVGFMIGWWLCLLLA